MTKIDVTKELARFWADHEEVVAYWATQSFHGAWEDSRDHFAAWIGAQGYNEEQEAAVYAALLAANGM